MPGNEGKNNPCAAECDSSEQRVCLAAGCTDYIVEISLRIVSPIHQTQLAIIAINIACM